VKLAELQALFQAAILAGRAAEPKVIALIAPKEGEKRETLFGVYVSAYRIRLKEFVQEDYPALRAFLGEKEFRALMKAYIAANPSKSRNARWFSTRLPEFMEAGARWRDVAKAVGLAKFERALADAFDAADAETRNIEALAEFLPQDWARLTFAFHPSLKLLQVAAGTLETYAEAMSEDGGAGATAADEDEAPHEGLEAVAVWRSNLDLSYRKLDDDEFMALCEAGAGRSFGEICQLVAFQDESRPPAERLAQFLVNWFSEGMVCAVVPATD